MFTVSSNPMNSLSHKDELEEKYRRQVEKVKEYLDKVKEENELQALVVIDSIQQLDLNHLFHEQIEAILEKQFLNTCSSHSHDLYEVSLRFRLLRQHGYNVPADVFHRFKGKNGCFLSQDIKGLMALHEATHLSIKGEGILDEAAKFSSDCLVDESESIMPRQTLQHPIHKNFPRFSTRDALQNFHVGDEWEAILKDIALTQFGKLQIMYKQEKCQALKWWEEVSLTEELKLARNQPLKWYMWSVGAIPGSSFSNQRMELLKPISLVYVVDDIFDVYGTLHELTLFTQAVNSWEISAIEQLPNYMRMCFLTLYETTENIASVVYKEHGWNPIDHLRKAWASLCNAFLKEAKWFASGEMPAADDYLENGIISSGVPMVLINLYFLLGHESTNFGLPHIQDIISSVAKILRLLDDLGDAKDEQQEGSDGSYVDYLMKEHKGLTNEEARNHVIDMVSNTWKDLNKHCITPSPIPQSFKKACLNVARMVPMMYIYDENRCLPALEEHIKSIFDGDQ